MRFSLRTLILLTASVCCFIAVIFSIVNGARHFLIVDSRAEWMGEFRPNDPLMNTVFTKPDDLLFFEAGFEDCLGWFHVGKNSYMWDFERRVKSQGLGQFQKKSQRIAFNAGFKEASDEIKRVRESLAESELRSKLITFNYVLAIKLIGAVIFLALVVKKLIIPIPDKNKGSEEPLWSKERD